MQVSKRKKSETEEEESKALHFINKLASYVGRKRECDIFGEITTAKLKALKAISFLLAKHGSQNVLLKVRMQALEVGWNDRPTKLKITQQPFNIHLLLLRLPYLQENHFGQHHHSSHSNSFSINPLGFFMNKLTHFSPVSHFYTP